MMAVALVLDSSFAFSSLRSPSTAFHGPKSNSNIRNRQDGSSLLTSYMASSSNRRGKLDTAALPSTTPATTTSSSNNPRWWNPLVTPKSTSSDGSSSSSVDEYLEFLERRYSRLYENDSSKQQASKSKFSVLSWLQQSDEATASSSSSSTTVETSSPADAWYALGVAGLAGKQLLEQSSKTPMSALKQNMPIDDAQVISTSASVVSTETATAASVFALRMAPLFRRLSAQRQRLLRYESQKLNSAVVFVLKTVLRLPVKVGKAVWNMGGGKKTIAVTLTVAAAVSLLMLRPIAEAVRTSLQQA